MRLKITPASLAGQVTPPSSKSMAHRLILAAALAGGESLIRAVSDSQDIQATIRGVEAMGAKVSSLGEGTLRVCGIRRPGVCPLIDCGESGSTLRFLIPVALAVCGGALFTGRGRLLQRPLEPYRQLLEPMGVRWAQQGDRLEVQGRLEGEEFSLPGDVSSQFVTGLLYGLAARGQGGIIRLTTPLESAGYVRMTLDALAQFGLAARWEEQAIALPAGALSPRQVQVEGDYSQAAFFFAANFLGAHIRLEGLSAGSHQGDAAVTEILQRMACPGPLQVDVRDIPDLFPVLAAAAALRAGSETRFTGTRRLRMKESDRIQSTLALLEALGGDAALAAEDTVLVRGRNALDPGVPLARCESFGDHRIAMTAAVAATRMTAPLLLEGAECVAKSYPRFWEDYKKLGGVIEYV